VTVFVLARSTSDQTRQSRNNAGATKPCRNLDQDFACRGRRRRLLAHDERRARALQHHGAHDPSPVTRKEPLRASQLVGHELRDSCGIQSRTFLTLALE
jgi:hypothetical protein